MERPNTRHQTDEYSAFLSLAEPVVNRDIFLINEGK